MGTTPQMALVKVVSDELTELMGSKGAKDLEQGFPQIVLMAGLQVGRNQGQIKWVKVMKGTSRGWGCLCLGLIGLYIS